MDKITTANEFNFGYLGSIIDCIPGSLYCKDLEGRYLWCNQFMLETLHIDSINDIVGKTDLDLWPGNARRLRRNDQHVIKYGKTIFLEEMMSVSNGETVFFTGVKMPLRNASNKIIGIIGNMIDITTLKQTEAELREAKEKAESANEANEEKNKFISNMEHDLRTPCSSILLTVEALETRKISSEVRQGLSCIVQATSQLLELLDSIIYFSRMKSGKLPILFKKFSIKQMVDDVVALELPLARDKKIKLLANCDHNIPKVLISDKHRVQRILINLVNNAVKFTQKGLVRIDIKLIKSTCCKNLLLRIAVRDTGIGIPEDKQRDIYERFVRVMSNTTDEFHPSGSGLGLSIVEQFVHDLDGEIKVKSRLHRGTEFVCILPFQIPLLYKITNGGNGNRSKNIDGVAKVASRSISFSFGVSRDSKQRNLKILLVEDNKLIREVTKVLLSNFTRGLDVASTGEKAVILARKNNYDLIFIDISLPDIDGCEVTKKIRKFDQVVPIVALTAHVSPKIKKHCLASKINDFLAKPLTNKKVGYIIAKWVTRVGVVDKMKLVSSQQRKNVDDIESTKNAKQSRSKKTQKIIDLQSGVEFVGNDSSKAIKTINMMLRNFDKKKCELERLYLAKQWKQFAQVVHYLRGGIVYCGTPRLRVAVKRLDDCLLTAVAGRKLTVKVNQLYENFLHEIERVRSMLT